MGNSHDKSHNKHHKNNQSQIDPNIEAFFKTNGLNDKEVEIDHLLKLFDNSFIFKKILSKYSTNQKIDSTQLKLLFSDIYQTFSNSSIFDLYINLLFNSDLEIDYDSIKRIFHDCLHFSLKCVGFKHIEYSDQSKLTLEMIVNHIQFYESNGKKVTNKESFKQWSINEFPHIFYGFHNWFLKCIKDQESEGLICDEKCTDLSIFLNVTLVWYFVNNLPNVYNKYLASENGTVMEKLKNCLMEKRWQILYSSETHGLSLNRFESSLFNYKAGTIVFIYCASGALFCVCSNEEYKESPLPYGDGQTRIYRIWKDFKIFDVTGSNNIYLNTKSRGIKLGLIYGYSQLKPIIKIDEDFHLIEHEQCKNDKIISVEAWGCGPRKAALEQLNLKKWENKQIEKMRTVKRGADNDWANDADKALLDLAGIKTEHSERGDF